MKIAGEDVEEEMVAEQEAAALDAIPGYDEETRALYAGGLSEKETPRRGNAGRVDAARITFVPVVDLVRAARRRGFLIST